MEATCLTRLNQVYSSKSIHAAADTKITILATISCMPTNCYRYSGCQYYCSLPSATLIVSSLCHLIISLRRLPIMPTNSIADAEIC